MANKTKTRNCLLPDKGIVFEFVIWLPQTDDSL